MTYDYKASCISRIGKVRNDNEDNFLFNGKTLPTDNTGLLKAVYMEGNTKEAQVMAVFDGMGGEMSGEIAAATAAETLTECCAVLNSKAMKARSFLSDAIDVMNAAVHKKSKALGLNRSGTTTAMLYLSLDQMYIANVGDSRIYRYASDELEQLSEDDVIYNPNLKNQHLTQYIGVDADRYSLQMHIKKGELSDGDIVLLCTDGLYNTLKEDEICQILKDELKDLTKCVERLANAVEENGGDDNCTVIIVKLSSTSWVKQLFSKW